MSTRHVILTTTIAKLPLGFRQNAWPVATLLFLIGFFFHTLPSGYWRADDTAILLHALNSKGLSAFYDPNDWQKLSPSNLTPWITFSFKVDLWLSGLSPKLFYVHQLCSLGMVAVAAYALSRQWVSPGWAFLSVCLFLVGAPTASVTELLMTRHYLEGMLFALLAMLAFVHALRQQRMPWAFAGALAYALAVTAKEIYVPLVLVVFAIPPVGNLVTRLRLASPFIGVAILYIFWRQYMLGAMIGGYADANSIMSFRSATGMIDALGHFPEFFFGSSWELPTILFCSTVAFSLFNRASIIPVSMVLVVGVVVPLVPLIAFPGISGPDRYLYLFWFVASLACVLSIQIAASVVSSNKKIQYAVGIPLCLVIMTSTISHTREIEKSRHANYQEFDVQGRFILEASKQQGFIPSQSLLSANWYVTSLCDIKKRMGLWCPLSLIKGVPLDGQIERLYAYDPVRGVMADISSKIDEEMASIESIDRSRPLFGTLSLENGWGRWHFGPYNNGQYYIASAKIGRYPVTKMGELKTTLTDLSFYIQYESPDGWITSSPLLVVRQGHAVDWERTFRADEPVALTGHR